MDCQISRSGDIALVEIVGSLDSSWSQFLAERLDEVVRTGAHEVQVDMSGVSYLSSNGIALLVRYHRQMRQIGGRFRIVSDSDAVGHVLKLTGVSNLLKNDEPPTDPRIRQARVGETFETDGMTLHVRKASRNQPCERLELMGDATRLPRKGYSEADDLVWRSSPRKAAIGLGALGPNFAACRARYGEFLAAGGVSTYRPSEGTGHPDFEQVAGSFVPEIHVLYGIGFTVPDGSTMVRYEAKGDPGDAAAPLHAIAQAALLHGDCGSAGIVMIGETAGLVGAAMRRSPIDMEGDMDVFAYAHARDWLSLTPEPEHARSTAIVVGVATQSPSRAVITGGPRGARGALPRGRCSLPAITTRLV
jgi:anti-sigma B factor antagonist/stage II sporulation protein AA (anti-sigma F factor antagonist)